MARRLIPKKNNYPLLASLGKEEILGFIKSHLKEREKFYKEAHHQFEVSKKTIQQTVTEIKRFI